MKETLDCLKRRTDLDDIFIGSTLVWVAVLGVLEQHVVHVCACVLKQLVGTAEHDESDLTVAQHTQLVRFLHQPELAFCERHLTTTNRL